MTTALEITVPLCLYLAVGTLIGVGTMRGQGNSHLSGWAEDFMRGWAVLAITLTWPLTGMIAILGRYSR